MAPKKKVVRKHAVKANLRVVELTKAGTSLDLEIFAGRDKLGTIVIGRGALYWKGASRQKATRIPWTRFAQMMDELAYGSR